MNKSTLSQKLSSETQMSTAMVAHLIDSIVASITQALRRGDDVTISGFGTLSTYMRKPRNGRNPRTGTLIKIAGRRVAKFTPGIGLKKAMRKSCP